jgi:hypothetical protein
VYAVARSEDVWSHFGVPTSGLVSEVNARLHHLRQGYYWHKILYS